MDRQEKLKELSKTIGDFEERFKKITINKEKSQVRKSATQSDSAPLPISTEFYQGRIPSVTLHKDLQNVLILKEVQNNPSFRTGVPADQIGNREVPQSSKEMTLNFTREERLLLYDYCVSATGHHSIPDLPFLYTEKDASADGESSSSRKTLTFAEIAAMEKKRRKRRRSAKDKQKIVRMTYTDELRSLIGTQMNAWEAFLREKAKKRDREKPVKRLK